MSDHYDESRTGKLEHDEAYQFLGAVLSLHERKVAKMEHRDPQLITPGEIEDAFEHCDIAHDNSISKAEMKTWLFKYMTEHQTGQARV